MCELYDKPFKNLDEQVIHLIENKKLKINDKDFAKKALITMSYYDLINGYKEPFIIDDTYKDDNISLEFLYTFHHFDHSFQNVLFQYTIYIEKAFKTAMSYVISEKFGVHENEYLKMKNFAYVHGKNRKEKLKNTLSKIKWACDKNNDYLDNPTKHYVFHHNHRPAWILFKNVNFATIIDLYSFLKSSEKEKVCKIILGTSSDFDKELLKNLLSVIRKYRNVLAHNLKFISYKTKDYFINYKLLDNKGLEPLLCDINQNGINDVYTMIIAMTVLLNDDYLIHEMLISLNYTVDRFTNQKNQSDLFNMYCNITGIPKDLFKRYNNYIKK